MITYAFALFKDFENFIYFNILKIKFSQVGQEFDKLRQLYTCFLIILEINKNICIIASNSSVFPLLYQCFCPDMRKIDLQNKT
ncbi:hypothetical protein A9239_05400 [Methanosarcina sp. A14]|nr:hypothetical protein A9239_05400 [Methanosarcina sp. A14]